MLIRISNSTQGASSTGASANGNILPSLCCAQNAPTGDGQKGLGIDGVTLSCRGVFSVASVAGGKGSIVVHVDDRADGIGVDGAAMLGFCGSCVLGSVVDSGQGRCRIVWIGVLRGSGGGPDGSSSLVC